MKAYILHEKHNEDKGQVVVFAETANKAKAQVYSTDLDPDDFIDVRVNRAPEFDGMEKLGMRELDLKKWREGWWFEMGDFPDPDEATDEEFYEAWDLYMHRK